MVIMTTKCIFTENLEENYVVGFFFVIKEHFHKFGIDKFLQL